jgi:hypothetical protein
MDITFLEKALKNCSKNNFINFVIMKTKIKVDRKRIFKMLVYFVD